MNWHHSPLHVFVPHTTYMVTAGTLHKEHFFRTPSRLRLLHDALLELAAPDDSTTLRKFISHLHTKTAASINREDAAPGRNIWFQYWDTCLTFEDSDLPRLRYVHENAVHHGRVPVAEQYEHCSARWFAGNAEPAFQRKVASYGMEKLEVHDDF